VNQAFEVFTGYTADEVLGQNSRFLLGEDVEQEPLAQIREAVKSGRRCTARLRNYRKDGTLFHNEVSLAPLHSRSGKVTHLVWMLRDVTAQTEKEKELTDLIAEKEHRFAAYAEHANEAIWRIDFEPPIPLEASEAEQVQQFIDTGIFTEANDAAARVYGLAAGKELTGRPIREFMPESYPKSVEVTTELVRHGFHMDNLISYETTVDDTKTAIVNNIKPGIEDGRVRHIWGASLDLSAFFEAQEDLEVSRKEIAAQQKVLEEKSAALRALVDLVEQDKKEIKERVAANVEQVLMPALEKIRVNNGQDVYAEQLRRALADLTSDFGRKLEVSRKKLTPREVEVCNLVKNGLDSKEVARALNIAVHTVEKHRRMARNKLGLANKGTNLRTYLNSL
jgi:PAS domain S-box-containing protein